MSINMTNYGLSLLERAERDVKTFDGLRATIDGFKNVADTFETLAKTMIIDSQNAANYIRDLQRLIDTLRTLYDVPKYKLVYVDPGRMTRNVWGNAFWKFLHTSSVLLQHAYHKERVKHFLHFPALLYNIDIILPCSVCVENYKNIKRTEPVMKIIENASFGLLVSSVYRFHALINKNHETPMTVNTPSVFREIDFALLYHCFPRNVTDSAVNVNFIKQPVIFHPSEHVKLSLLLSVCYNVNLFHVSNLLMRFYGPHEFAYETVAHFDDRDVRFILPDRTELKRTISYCFENKKPPSECKSEYFKNVATFKNIAHYWSLLMNFKNYKVTLDDGETVTLRDGRIMIDANDTGNPVSRNSSFTK